ncbi:MAG: GreA/GreB family elongation factor [Bacteroidales bacterium]|nr:GreA/GreB family elongation factor [Bacteroidales bacterium]
MSRGFVKEGDQEEVPMVLPRAFLPSGTPNYVTPEGLKRLQDEMESLKEEWSAAGSNYVTKNYLDAKMRLLSERINSAVLIDNTKVNPDVVSFGMYVKYNDKVIRIVGVDEADASKGLISFISPIAKALIGKKKGDKFEIKVPRGTEIVEIFEISQQVNETTSQREEKSISPQVNETTSQRVEKSIRPQDNETTRQREEKSIRLQDHKSISSESKSASMTEFLPLVNEQGNIVGRALHFEIHNGNKVMHPAVHLLIYNTKKEIVAKYWWHVAFGETAEKTLKRKLKEMESQTIKPKFKKQYIREDKNEKELVSVFTAVCDGEIHSSQCDKDYDKIFEKSVV